MEESEQIRRRAHQIWQAEGSPEGRDAKHWARAQEELRQAGVLDRNDALGHGYQNDTSLAATNDPGQGGNGPADGHIIEPGEGGTAGGPDEADEALSAPEDPDRS